MAILTTFDRLTFNVMRSKWTVFMELLFVVIPISLAFTPALLFLFLVVAFKPVAVIPLTLLDIGGIWGLASLWRYFFSLFRPFTSPRWAQFGLVAGSVTVLGAFMFGKNLAWSPLLSCIPVAAHWYWLKRNGILLFLRTPNAS